MKVFNAFLSLFRRRWTRPLAFSYDDFEISDFDHSPYVDYSTVDEDEASRPNLS